MFNKDLLKEKTQELFGSEYEVKWVEQETNGRIKRNGLVIRKNHAGAAPCVYIDELVKGIEKGDLTEKMAAMMIHSEYMARDMDRRNQEVEKLRKEVLSMSKESILEKVVFELVNTEKRVVEMQNVVYREMLDLSVIYKFEFSDGKTRTFVTDWIAKLLGLTEEELYEAARRNDLARSGYKIMNHNQAIDEMIENGVVEPGEIEEQKDDQDLDDIMVMTNADGILGSSIIIHPEMMEEAAKRAEGDFWIIPLSRHQLIALPVKTTPYSEVLFQMMTLHMDEDWPGDDLLSTHAYRYNAEKKQLSIA